MPTVTETPIEAYAHCVNARCAGNAQVTVDAVLVVTGFAYHEQGGDGMFSHPERTTEQPRFADPEESKCEYCGSNRDLSREKRMSLDDSGYDRDALLDISPDARDPDSYTKGSGGHVVIEDDARTSALEGQNADLREQLAELRGIVLGQQSVQAPVEAEPEVAED